VEEKTEDAEELNLGGEDDGGTQEVETEDSDSTDTTTVEPEPEYKQTEVEKVDFSVALKHVKSGRAATRVSHNGEFWVEVQQPDSGSKMTQPYLFAVYSYGGMSPYTPTNGDLLAVDWILL